MASDKIKIACPACGNEITEQAKKIRGGLSLACPHCKQSIKFEDGSPHESIRKALSVARKLRRQATPAF
jgi:transposase-like protein